MDDKYNLKLIAALEAIGDELKRSNDLKEQELGVRSKDISNIAEEFVEGGKPRLVEFKQDGSV